MPERSRRPTDRPLPTLPKTGTPCAWHDISAFTRVLTERRHVTRAFSNMAHATTLEAALPARLQNAC
jgi:hypothetical protein